jgi:hypothetical protein
MAKDGQMKRVLALAAMTAALAGCSTGLFQSAVPNTLPGTPAASAPPAAAPVTPISSAPVAPVSTAPAETVRLDPRDQGLLDADRSFAGAVLDHGLGAGLAAIVEADATVVTPGGVFIGADQIRTGLRPGANAGQLFWIPEKASTGASADYGSTSGRYVQVLRGAEAVQGRYVTVWRKDAANRWRIVSATAMPVRIAAPAAAPAPAAVPPAKKKPIRR